MDCPYCGSHNVQTHVVKKDKFARNLVVMLIALILVFSIALLVSAISKQTLQLCAFYCFAISLPVLFIVEIILLIIPSGLRIIVICCDCGEVFEICVPKIPKWDQESDYSNNDEGPKHI